MAPLLTEVSTQTPIVTVLDKTEHYQITSHDIGSDTTIVTFGFWMSGVSEKGFGTDFCLKNGFNTIYVCNKGIQRFENLSLEEFTEAVREPLQGKTVYAYGISLGGYGAVYYGGSIDARIVAFSPRNSAHPITQLSKQKFTHKYIVDNPVSSHTPIIIIDPFEETDFKFLTEGIAPAYKKIQFVNVDNAGHSSFGAVHRSGKLKEFLLNAFSGNFKPITIEDKFKTHLLTRKAKAMLNCAGTAEQYLQDLLKIDSSTKTIDLAKEFIVKHRQHLELPPIPTQAIKKSLTKLDHVFTKQSRAFDVLVRTAEVMEETGQFDAAIALYSTAQVRWPGSKKVQDAIENLQVIIDARNNAVVGSTDERFEFNKSDLRRSGT